VRVPRAFVDLRPLRESAPFRRLWLGMTASGFGSNVGTFAVVFYVWDRTHNAAMVGLIGLVTALPLIVFALLGSAFTDHVDRRRLVRLAMAGQLVTSLLLAFVAASPGNGVWAMFGLAAVASGLSAIGTPAIRAFVPRLLPTDRLAAGLALNHMSFQVAMLFGPIVAGVLAAQWGVAVCFLVDAVTFLAALAATMALPGGAPSTTDSRAGAGAVWAGIRLAARTPPIRGALLADLTATVLAMPMMLFPVVNEEKFGGSPEILGLFTASVAAGGVLASALSGSVTRLGRPGVVLLASGAAWGTALVGVGLSGHLAVVLGLLAVAGAADTWAVVSRGTVAQASTPESHRGRVSALEHIVGVAGPQLGMLRAGLVAAATSGSVALVTGGLSCVLGLLLIVLTVPQLHRFRLPRPAPAVDRPPLAEERPAAAQIV